MRKFLNIFLISLMVFSLFANFALAEDIRTIDFNKSVKNFSYSIDGKQTTDQILISKLSDKDLDRNNDNLKITFIQNNLLNTIKVEDNINTKGGIFYVPYDTCVKLLGDAPYGINDHKYDPKLVEIDHINYYQFDINHFSTVNITDWLSNDHEDRISITVDSSTLSNDVNNAILVFYFSDNNVSDNNVSGAITDADNGADDFKFYALNPNGSNYGSTPTICSYDPFSWSVGTGGFIAVEIPMLDTGSDLTMYMYYNGSGDWDDISGTYNNSIGIWHLESDGSDSSGNGLTFTGTNIASGDFETVKLGKGVNLDGSSEYFSRTVISFEDTGHTILSWVDSSSATTGQTILGYSVSNSYIYFSNGVLYYGDNGDTDVSATYSGFDNLNLVSITRNNISSTTIYKNGSALSGTGSSSQDISIDRIGVFSTYYFSGLIDDIWVFSDIKTASWISAYYKSCVNTETNFYTFGTASDIPTYQITQTPINTTYDNPTSLDINVSITNNASVTFEECNLSYYDGSWHTIKNRILYNDADINTWTTTKISFNWDDTTSFPTENLSNIKVKACLYDGSIWYNCAESANFSLSFGVKPIFTSPTNASFLDEDPTFNWNFEDGFTYNLVISENSDLSGTPVYNVSNIEDPVLVTTLENYTKYYAGVRGYDGNYTDWSDTLVFKTAFPPVITSPEDDDIISFNLNVELIFDYDACGQIEISDDNFITADYNNTFWLDDDIPFLENNKEYDIRVRSLVNHWVGGSPSYTTDWSEVITITTDLKPVIVYPEDAETITDTQDIELDWDPLGTVLGGSFLWYIQVAKDANFTDINASYSAIDYQPTVTLNNGVWYWRVRGYENVYLYYSNYSDVAEFTVDYSSVQCNDDLNFTYPEYDATFPTNDIGLEWSEVANASTYYVKVADNALMDDSITYGISGNTLLLTLEEGTYYLDLRVKYLDDTYSQWLSICDQLHKFNVENPSIDAPVWVLPSTAEVEEGLITFSWSEIADADRYWIQFYDNSTFDPDDLDDPALLDQRVPLTNSIQLTLDSGLYWIVVKAEVDGDYSNWSSTKSLTVTKDGELPTFDPEDKPTWITPEEVYLESGTIAYSWSSVVGATGYDIQISTSPTFASYVLNTSTSNTYYTAYLNTSDEYYTRVRAKDSIYNGAWSETKYFELVIEEVEYIYTPNTVNLYGGDTLVYEFTGMEPDTTYTFKINSLDNDGQFFQNVATKIITSDGDGDGSFTHVFSGSAFYPFEVRDDDINYRLLTHFVAPKPTHLYLDADHRLEVNGSIISVAVGDVAYNTQSGILHDPYQPEQSLYQYGDYLLIHYSIPDPEDATYGIVIKNIATGANVGIIASDDLYTFNRELGYAKRNFIVVSTNGVKPYIIDQWVELDDYTGDDWHSFNFDKGAYDYALLELDGDNTVIGESVILIGDDNVKEWDLTAVSATVKENFNQTFNFTVNTSEIWDAYNYMYFLDKSSGLFKIGSSSGYVKHPFSYQSSFNLVYAVTTELYDDGAGRWGIRPFRYNFNADLEDVYYEYLIEKSFIITPVTDATTAIGEFLTLVGLGTPEGKLIFSLGGVIVGIVAVVLLGVPVGLAGLIGLIILAIFTALGFIPIWTIIIIGLGMFLLLLRTFLSGGGGGE